MKKLIIIILVLINCQLFSQKIDNVFTINNKVFELDNKVFTSRSGFDTTGLRQWLEADSLNLTGSLVNYMYDKSGKGYNVSQSITAKKPLKVANGFQNKAVVRFDGIDDFLQNITSPILTQPLTVIAIWKGYTQLVAVGLIFDGGDPDIANRSYVALFSASNRYSLNSGSITPLYITKIYPTYFFMNTFYLNGASTSIYENATLKGSGDPGTRNLIGVTLGAAPSGSANFGCIDLIAYLSFTGILSAARRAEILEFFNKKYNFY